VTGREWIDAYAAALGVDAPDDRTFEALLDLAGTAAHASERIAAPVACWLVGRSGLTVEAAAAIAADIGGGTATG
jgi:threonine dehydratase